MANGAVRYQFIDEKLATTSGGGATPPLGVTDWAPSTTYATGAFVRNGGFLFRCSAGGASAASGVGPTPQYLTDNAATWVLSGPASGLCVSEAAQSQELGYSALAKDVGPNAYDVGEFMYVKFTGSTDITAGDFVQVDRLNKTATQSPTALASANSPVVIGIAMASHKLSVATPTYGWVMVRGVHDGANVTTGSTAGYCCSLGAAAGRLIGGGYVLNKTVEAVIARSVSANNQGTVELYWPMASGR